MSCGDFDSYEDRNIEADHSGVTGANNYQLLVPSPDVWLQVKTRLWGEKTGPIPVVLHFQLVGAGAHIVLDPYAGHESLQQVSVGLEVVDWMRDCIDAVDRFRRKAQTS